MVDKSKSDQKYIIKAVHILITICLVVLALFLIPSCVLMAVDIEEPPLQIVIPTVIEFVSSVGLIWILSKGNWKAWGLFLSTKKIPKAVCAGLLVGIAVTLIGTLIPTIIEFKPMSYGEMPFIYQILCFWLLMPVGEEAVFRGLAQGYLHAHIEGSFRLGKWRVSYPALIGAILFGLMHISIIGA